MKNEQLAAYLKTVEEENRQMRAGTWPKPASATVAKKTTPQPTPPTAEPIFTDEVYPRLAGAMRFVTQLTIVEAIRQAQRQRDTLVTYREGLAKYRTNLEIGPNATDEGARLTEQARRGEPLTHGTDSLTRASKLDFWKSRKLAVTVALKKVVSDSAELARPVMAQFKTEATAFVDDLEKAEKQQAEKFFVQYETSSTIKSLRQAIRALAKRIPENPDVFSLQNPLQFLPWIEKTK